MFALWALVVGAGRVRRWGTARSKDSARKSRRFEYKKKPRTRWKGKVEAAEPYGKRVGAQQYI